MAAAAFGGDLHGFLIWEALEPDRHERVGGVVRLMAGGSEDHDRIGMNVGRLSGNAPRGTACNVHGSNLRVVNRRTGDVAYPDVFVRCGPRDGRRQEVDDPVLPVEVLPDSTAGCDLTRKRLMYKGMPTVRRVLDVSQREARVDWLVRREDGGFEDGAVEGLGAALELPELGLSRALAEVYEGTDVAGDDAPI